MLLLRHDPVHAIPFLERGMDWHPDDASVSYALGVACQLTQDWRKAEAAFQATVKIDPRYYEGWLRLASAAARSEDVATCSRALAQAKALPEARDGRAEQLARELLGRQP